MKKCSRCGIVKPKSEFFKRSDRPCGVQPACRECSAERAKLYRSKNKQKIRASRQSAYYKNHKETLEKAKEYRLTRIEKARESCREWMRNNVDRTRESHYRLRYGITAKEYNDLVFKQKGICAICGNPETMKFLGKTKKLSIDHCHETGKVRGLLCSSCNIQIGFLERGYEPKDNLSKKLAYLEKSQ